MSLVEVYKRLASTCAEDTALSFRRIPHLGVELTWGALCERSLDLAEKLAARRVREGTRCAVVLADHPDLLPLLLAVWRVEAVVVPVDPMWGEQTTAGVLEHSGAEVVILVGPDGLETASRQARVAPVLPSGTAMISYTSGSASNPKGVVLKHRHLLAAYEGGAQALGALLGGPPRRMGCVMRMSGLGVLGMHYLWSAVLGAEVVVMPELGLANVRTFWAEVAAAGVDLTYLVPPLVNLVARLASTPPPDMPPMYCLSGGAALSPAVQERFQDRFGAVLMNAYGLTECSFAVFFGDLNAGGWGTSSIGRSGSCEARLVDDSGAVVIGPGQGELQLSGSPVSAGYYDNDRANYELFDDVWVRTGDVAARDDEGRYWIVGRHKDVVLKGAFTVYLTDLEEAAVDLDGVTEAAAVRIDLPCGGEDVGLIVVGDNDEALRMIPDELVRRLGRQRAPRRVVQSSERLPRIGQGKLDRCAVQALWARLSDA